MKILVLTHYFYPHVGGVEKHVLKTSKIISNKKNDVVIVTENQSEKDNEYESKFGLKIVRFQYPHKKFIGLFKIWCWLYKNRHLIKNADIVHSHDIFVWLMPFKLLYRNVKNINTIHGLEWDDPLNKISILQKRLAIRLSDKSVGIGDFLEKYIGRKFDLISYGAADIHDYKTPKERKRIAYVGRLEENTGLLKFLKWLGKNPGYKVDFCGDGDLRKKCEKYGTVHGFGDPNPFYKKAKLVVPGGYLAAMEALNSGCDIKLFWNNKVKEDYWKMSPFYKLKGEELRKWARKQTWEKLANEYLDLYNSIK